MTPQYKLLYLNSKEDLESANIFLNDHDIAIIEIIHYSGAENKTVYIQVKYFSKSAILEGK